MMSSDLSGSGNVSKNNSQAAFASNHNSSMGLDETFDHYSSSGLNDSRLPKSAKSGLNDSRLPKSTKTVYYSPANASFTSGSHNQSAASYNGVLSREQHLEHILLEIKQINKESQIVADDIRRRILRVGRSQTLLIPVLLMLLLLLVFGMLTLKRSQVIERTPAFEQCQRSLEEMKIVVNQIQLQIAAAQPPINDSNSSEFVPYFLFLVAVLFIGTGGKPRRLVIARSAISKAMT
jgi:hypothetical protein